MTASLGEVERDQAVRDQVVREQPGEDLHHHEKVQVQVQDLGEREEAEVSRVGSKRARSLQGQTRTRMNWGRRRVMMRVMMLELRLGVWVMD